MNQNRKFFGLAMLWLLFSQLAFGQSSLVVPDTLNYHIADSVMIRTANGITLSAVVVRKKNAPMKQPTALMYLIYSDTKRSLAEAKYAADQGYVGMVADARGKRLSPDDPVPYEKEAEDVNSVISWIVQQDWSDGRVGMYGGSYSGFAQWAATKNLNPALKTIVPYVAAIPGLGLPMENNIFLLANYQWPFYVTNNKYTDDGVNEDGARWRSMRMKWWESGLPYHRVDSLDGTANPWFQKWLRHPDYDAYWQSMVPFKEEFAKINIPVLSITGYYDDGQVSALEYLREHYKYRPNAEHYLIIGPYDHFGAQKGGNAILRGYQLDKVALINTRKITFQWMDYIFKGAQRPELIKDKINFQVMGANVWKHVSSMDQMESGKTRFYLDKVGTRLCLSPVKPFRKNYIPQTVDLADRKSTNNDYYPDPIIKKEIDKSNGLFYLTEPFEATVTISGKLEGVLKAVVNKKDMDVGLTLYELSPKGEYFQLSYFLGRASYAEDMTQRKLLRPGKEEAIPFYRSRVFSRQIKKGSRLLLVLNIDKNPFAQINYGTGKDVSKESIYDAGTPLNIKWSNESFIDIGISRKER